MSFSKPAQTAKLPAGLLITFVLLLCTMVTVSYWVFHSSSELLDAYILIDEQQNHEAAQQQRSTVISEIKQHILLACLFLTAAALVAMLIIMQRARMALHVQQETSLQQLNRDPVTGLPNRTLFLEQLKLSIAQADRHKKLVAVIRINIDRFNQINTGLGHRVADQLLKQFAQCLTSHVRACDIVARMGGDDFGIILGELDRKDEIEIIVQRLLSKLDTSFHIDTHVLDISTSTGIAVYPIDQNDVDTLLLSADSAMGQAKKDPAQNYIFFSADMGVDTTSRLHEEQSLRQALKNKEFCLYYQPKVDSAKGTIKGFEALIRWQHPERGLVPPVTFIPVLEESGLIIPVGEWVIRETCEAIQRWMQMGLSIAPVSVNVSAPQFNQKEFVQRIQSILADTGVDAGYLELEITESCLMSDAEANIQILKELKALGMAIAVDDFGTGYSSLNHLNRFPIDTLKIDRSFIKDVNKRQENDNAGIVTAIMSLSHSLRLNVVAEGVETAHELAFLYALGCRTIQGFLFSKPLAEADVIKLLQDSQSINDVLSAAREELAVKTGS